MKTIRIFISSPGDVAEERDRARCVVEELRRRYAGRLELQAVMWEDLPLQADMSFQQGIDLVLSGRGVDIAVFILWSRLGSPVGAFIRRADGGPYRSGTEREWDLMWQARTQSGGERPRMIVYTRRDEPSFDERLRGLRIDEKEQLVRQKILVEQFIAEEFHDADGGENVRAYHSFDRPTTFALRLRVHLQELLDPLAGGELLSPVWDMQEKGPPFLGLDAFEFEHAPVFFGREDEIVAVRQLLREQARRGCAFVLITGASGSGKSSLARAGVLPAVAAHEVDAQVSGWRVAVLTPGEGAGDLLSSLAGALASDASLPALPREPDAVRQLAADLAAAPELVCRRVLRPALEEGGRRDRLIVLVDQFEEVFTDQRNDATAREAFLRALETLARSGCAWVLATVRSDFYAHCQSLEALVRMKEGAGQFDLVLPGADALDRLIRQPAALAGLRFEKRGDTSLADVIVRDAAAHRELLPLLEYLLHRLCAERTSDGVLTFATYEALGGVEGALARRADAVVAEVKPAAATLDALLSALVTLSGDEQESFVRTRVPRAELERDEGSRTLVAALIGERLLTSSGPAQGPAVVTVSHEALFRVWRPAFEWLGRNREFLRLRASIAQSHQRWTGAGRDASLLLPPGLPLAEASRLLAIEAGRLDAQVRGYVVESLAHHEAQKAARLRRQRVIVAALSVLAFIAIVGALLGWRGYHESSRERLRAEDEAAKAREAGVRNERLLRDASMADYSLAVQRFDEDHRWHEGVAHLARALDWMPENRFAAARLYGAIAWQLRGQDTAPASILHAGVQIHDGAFSPGGALVATAGEDKSVRLWNALTGAAIGEPMMHSQPVNRVVFSPDGRRLMTGCETNGQPLKVRLWDVGTAAQIGDEFAGADGYEMPRFSNDGTRVIINEQESIYLRDAATSRAVGEEIAGTARESADGKTLLVRNESSASLWSLATGRRVGVPMKHDAEVTVAEFSPDGQSIVTASTDGTWRLWNVASGLPLGALHRQVNTVKAAQFSPDGKSLLIVFEDGDGEVTGQVWRVSVASVGGEESVGKPMKGYFDEWQFVRGGAAVFAAGRFQMQFFSSSTGEPESEPAGVNLMGGVTLSPDESRRFSIEKYGNVTLWDDWNNELFSAGGRDGLNNHEASFIEFSADGALLLVAMKDRIRVVDSQSGGVVGAPITIEGELSRAAFSPDRRQILACAVGAFIFPTPQSAWSEDPYVKILQPPSAGVPLETSAEITCLAFSPDGRRILAGFEGGAEIFDAASGRRGGLVFAAGEPVSRVALSRDGSRVATVSKRSVRVWDAATGKALSGRLRHSDELNDVDFSPDGTHIVAALGDFDSGAAVVWEIATGRMIGKPLVHTKRVGTARYNPDGTRILTSCEDKVVRLWDAATGESTGTALEHEWEVSSAVFSPDGARIFTGNGRDEAQRPLGCAQVWDARTGARLGEFGAGLNCEELVVSADGAWVFTPNAERVWDAASGKPLGAPLHEAASAAAISPDGTRIAIGGAIWDVRHLRESALPVPAWMRDRARALAGLEFDSDGEFKPMPLARRFAILHEPPPGEGEWAELARWIARAEWERPIVPGSEFTQRQLAERMRDCGALTAALGRDPSVPLARLFLMEQQWKNENPVDRTQAEHAEVAARRKFYRDFDLKQLPPDAGLWARASASLAGQREFQDAIAAARKALSFDAASPVAKAALSEALSAEARAAEVDRRAQAKRERDDLRERAKAASREAALAVYEQIMAGQVAEAVDYGDAGYVAAQLGHAERARSIFREADAKFAGDPRLPRMKGWALLHLRAYADAVTAFQEAEALAVEDEAFADAVSGLVASRWMNGDKDGAVADQRRLIELFPYRADAESVRGGRFPAIEAATLLQALEETLKRFPMLRPAKR